MSLDCGNRVFCDVRVGQLAGTTGLGIYRLQVTVHLDVKELKPEEEGLPGVSLTDLEGDMKFKGQPFCRLRVLDPPLNLTKSVYSNKRQVDLYADLSRAQIEAIESQRGLGELRFDVRFRGRFVKPLFVPAQTSEAASSISLQLDIAAYECQFTVSQSAWVELLDRWNYTDTILVELAIPRSGPPKLADAIGHFKAAQSAMLRPDPKSVVRDCRCVLDDLAEAKETVEERRDGMIKLLQDKRDNSKAERFLLLRKALSHVCDPSAHGGSVPNSIDWQRGDAMALLVGTAAMLLRAIADDCD